MTARLLPAVLILAAMIGAPTLAHVMRPTERIADQGPKIDLEAMIPKQFGDWHMSDTGTSLAVNPQQAEMIGRIYSQTLNRTYTNANGYRIMLSIAYGGDQSDSMQVHKPEVCYPAQGFAVLEGSTGILTTAAGPIPVKRMLAQQGTRYEPVTYWTTIGNQTVSGSLQKKLVEMKYGVTGKIPDGLLFRMSSIDRDARAAYLHQEAFASQLIEALPAENLRRLTGIQARQ
jgi:EpsI family protein